MKLSNFSKVMIFSLVLGLASSAFAADMHKANFSISESVQVNGTQLAPGDYVATWAGAGPDVQLNITRNGKPMATAPAKVVQLERKSSDDSAEILNGDSGRQLTGLQFAGKKYSLEIGSGQTTATNESAK